MPFQSNLFRQNLNRNKIKQQKFFNKPPHYCYIVTPACGQCGPLRGLLPASVSSVQAPSCHYTLSLSLIVFRYCRHRTDTGNTCSVFSLTFLHNFNYQPAPAYLHSKTVWLPYSFSIDLVGQFFQHMRTVACNKVPPVPHHSARTSDADYYLHPEVYLGSVDLKWIKVQRWIQVTIFGRFISRCHISGHEGAPNFWPDSQTQ